MRDYLAWGRLSMRTCEGSCDSVLQDCTRAHVTGNDVALLKGFLCGGGEEGGGGGQIIG